VAFDLEKGRLWVVCGGCRRWSLVPLESRWETLEELERLTSGGARCLSKTDHVSLFREGSLEIVRIGTAELAEEAWWRYGRQLPDQSRLSRWAPPLYRRFRFGVSGWVGEKSCPECGHPFRDLPYTDAKILTVQPGGEFGEGTSFSLVRRCPRCKDLQRGGLRLGGVEAELTLARFLAFQNFSGESRVTVQAAARLLENPEGPADLVRLLSRYGRPLGELQPMGLTALEFVVNAARERTLMRLEAEALQARWRREEELAALIDGELSPLGPLGALLWKVRGKSGS